MKEIICIIICYLFVSCSPQSEETDNSEPIKKNKQVFVNLSKEHIGFWVNEEYFTALQKMKSTKKASDNDIGNFYRISENNSIMNLNIHEGGSDDIIQMDTKNKGRILSPDSSETYHNIEFQGETLLVDNKKFIKTPNNENGLNELVNRAFFSGKYLISEKEIEFKENGNIIGLDSIQSYTLNLDYNDAGMQFDKIDLQFNGEKEPRTYIYEFNLDTLIISEIDCKTLEYNFCVEIEKGQMFYRLLKK
tara:strand:+ start:160 stop:903 length:744 start_codon:yes stop_codon:yes gene_type:complete